MLTSPMPRFGSLPRNTQTGVSTHLLRNQTPADLPAIRQAGFSVSRDDKSWDQVERQPGVYDFTAMDRMVANMRQNGIRPMLILGGNHSLYTRRADSEGYGLIRPFEIDAFRRFVIATLRHYQGQDIIWELWNEPNHPLFWKPKPDVQQYIGLARQVLPAMRQADPAATIIAPCTAGSPIPFIKACLDAGLMQWVDGVSIHPYQAFNKIGPVNRDPEFAMAEIEAVRQLMNDQGYRDKAILLGEWGYSTALGELSETQQAAYAARHYLLGLYYKTPVNIWYDWKDDGTEPANKEHHFGLRRADLSAKPAYTAVSQLIRQLKGFQFMSRLPMASVYDHAWVFKNNQSQRRVVAWTQGVAHPTVLPGFSTPVPLTTMPQVLV